MLATGRVAKTRLLSAVNLLGLLAHQYEEYVDPGYFPGQFNRGLFKSDSPRNYPLNPQTAMVINTALAYPFYLGPVFLRRPRWVSLAPGSHTSRRSTTMTRSVPEIGSAAWYVGSPARWVVWWYPTL